jgi:hypothetical protein
VALTARLAERASGRTLLALLLLAAGVFSLFGVWLIPQFQAATGGRYPIDMGFPLTPAVIAGELVHYTAASRHAYTWFFLVDLLWPPLLALVFALAWCWLAKRTTSALPVRWLGAGLLALPATEALLDVAENFGFLALIQLWPVQPAGLAWTASMLHNVKLPLYGLCWLTTLLFISLALLRRRTARP